MAVSDHFDPVRDTGFIRVMESCDARRQLRVSVAIVAIMAIAAIAVIAMPRMPHGAYAPAPIKLTAHAPQPAQFLQATRAVS